MMGPELQMSPSRGGLQTCWLSGSYSESAAPEIYLNFNQFKAVNTNQQQFKKVAACVCVSSDFDVFIHSQMLLILM